MPSVVPLSGLSASAGSAPALMRCARAVATISAASLRTGTHHTFRIVPMPA
jgi:hypothetical protein